MKVLTAISLLVLGNALAWAETAPAGPRLLDVSHYDIEVEVDPQERFLEGTAKVTFKVLENILSIPFDFNNQLSILSTMDQDGNRYSTRFDDLSQKNMRVQGPKALNPGAELTLTFRFEGNLEGDEFAFLNVARTEKAVISPDGALLLSEGRWFPQHLLPFDSATVKVRVRVPLGFSAVAPGRLESIRTEGVTEVFNWSSDYPLTEVPVVVSQFLRQTFKEGPVPISFHVREDFKGDLTPWAQEIGKILEFYNQEYGPSPLSGVDLVSVGKVELETSGSFGLVLLESGLLDAKRMPVMELAKRLARHWWGYSVRPKGDRDVFLREGFCTYAALRYMEVNQADDFRGVLAGEAVDAMKHQKLAPITEALTFKPGSSQYESIVGSKGAWVLYMLGQLIGRDAFNGYFKEWYQERKDQETGTQDFVDFVQRRTGEDYGWFFVQWVESVGVPEFKVDYNIYKLRDGTFQIRGQVKQDIDLFRMPADLRIETKGDAKDDKLVIGGRSTSFKLDMKDRPLRVLVDPNGKILNDSDRMRVLVHIALGEDYQRKSEFVAAIQEFEKAKEMDPRSSMASYRLGEVFFQQHSFSNSANAFRESLNGNLNPPWIETWIHIYLGKIYDILGQRERAKSEYRKAANSKIDYNGAQAEAKKYLEEPFTRPRTVSG